MKTPQYSSICSMLKLILFAEFSVCAGATTNQTLYNQLRETKNGEPDDGSMSNITYYIYLNYLANHQSKKFGNKRKQ